MAGIDSFDGDVVELEKTLRMVEKRRGDLAGIDGRQGERTDLTSDMHVRSVPETETNPRTLSRWRTIARNWDEV